MDHLIRLEQRIDLHPGMAVEQMRREIDATLATYQQRLRDAGTQPCGGPTSVEVRQQIERASQQTFTKALE
jgi:hypothetical protein